jgi:carbon monoxide dehydrogenase subunit G
VYHLLQDPAILRTAMPGCEELIATDDGRYSIRMNVVIAALTGNFAGTVEVSDPRPHSSFRMLVEASGRVGFLKGEGVLTVAPDTNATTVSYEGSAHIGGTMASVGQRLLDATSKMMIRKFFERFSETVVKLDGTDTAKRQAL